MKFGLDEKDLNNIVAIFQLFPEVEDVILYGSRAKGDFKPASDIDLTIKGKGLALGIISEIDWKLDDLLLPYTFDLSNYDHLKNSDLLEHIERVGISIYEKA